MTPWSLPVLRGWLEAATTHPSGGATERARESAGQLSDPRARAAALVIVDLLRAGWTVTPQASGSPTFQRPPALTAEAERARRRAQLHLERAAQLRSPPVRSFLSGMERSRMHGGRLCSVQTLMRDGAALSLELRRADGDPALLEALIQPAVEVVEVGARCGVTGLLLSDIWRYFRHTWATPYRSAPGRGLAVLIRDEAVPERTVIGIGMLGNSPAQILVRDRWIGWTAEQLVEECRARPTDARCRWVEATLAAELGGLFVEDLIADRLVGPSDLLAPTAEVIRRLREEGRSSMEAHHRFTQGAAAKRSPLDGPPHLDPALATGPDEGEDDQAGSWGEQVDEGGRSAAWGARARSPLFRAKRCALLADLLSVRLALRRAGPLTPSGLRALAAHPTGAQALTTLARRQKASRMGVALAEIMVCGAISPYRELIGGKLVAMLMAGAEVRRAWERRYIGSTSQIASAMAGRPVRRDVQLGLLVTTSLYGPGAQYNRAHLPDSAGDPLTAGPVRYRRIGATGGYGSAHLSPQTAAALVHLVSTERGGRRAHSLFGEGVSPRMRALREGLDRLDLQSEELLRHGGERAVYVVELGAATRPWLCGLAPDPQLFDAPDSDEAARAATVATSRYWLRRWAAPRAGRPEVWEAVARHRLSLPLRHGARVELPEDDE